jgi:hypothetical protein
MAIKGVEEAGAGLNIQHFRLQEPVKLQERLSVAIIA